MPDITFAIRAITTFDPKGFTKMSEGLRTLRLSFLGFEQVALVLNRVGKAFTAIGAVPLKALSSTVDAAASFTNAITQMALVSPKLASQVDQLSEDFLRISGVLPLSAQQLAEVGVEASRAGINTREGINALALLAGKLGAISADLSAVQAAKALAALTTQFRDTSKSFVQQSTEIADALAKLRLVGLGTAGELVNITKRFGFMAKQMGFTAAQAIAFGAVFRKAGIQVEVAGTAMSKLLGRMAAQSEKFAAASGISAKELENLIDSGQGLNALLKFMTGLNEKAGGSFVELEKRIKSLGLRGERMQPVLIALAKRQDLVSQALEASTKTVGELDRQFGIFSKSLGKRIDTLVGSFENLKISFGLILEPLITPFIEALTFLFNVFVALPAPIKLLIVLISILAAAVFLTVGTVFLLIAAFATAVISMTFLTLSIVVMILSLRKGTDAFDKYGKTIDAKFTVKNVKAAASANALTIANKLLPGPVRKVGTALSRLVPGFVATAFAAGSVKALFLALSVVFAKIVVVVLFVVATLIALRREIEDVFKAFTEIFSPIGTLIKGMADIAGAADPSRKGSVGSAFMAMLRFALFPVILVLKALAFAFRVVAQFAKALVANILAAFGPLKGTLERFFLGLENIKNVFRGLFVQLGLFSDKSSFLGNVLEVLGVIFRVMLRGVFFSLLKLVTIFRIVIAVVAGIIEGVLRALAPIFNIIIEIKNEFAAAFDDIKKSLQPIIDVFGELFGAISKSGTGFDFFGVIVQVVSALIRIALIPVIFVLKVLAFFVKAIAVAFRLLALIAAPLFKVMSKALAPVIKQITLFFTGVKKGQSFLEKFSDSLKFFFEDVGNLAGAFIDALLAPFTELFKNLDKVKEAFKKLEAFAEDPGKVLSEGILKDVRADLERLEKAKAKARGQPVKRFFIDVGIEATKAVRSFFLGFQEGGVVGSTGLALVHAGEVVIPADVVAELPRADRIPFSRPASTMTADSMNRVLNRLTLSIQNLSSAIRTSQGGVVLPSSVLVRTREVDVVVPTGGGGVVPVADRRPLPVPLNTGDGGGAPTNLEIVIPVSVKLDDLELGRTVVRITEEEIRRQFGTRGIRLAGVG